MASSITSGNATNGLAIASDNTGALDIKTGSGSGTTAISISSSQVVTGTVGNLMLISGTAVASTSGTSIDFTGIPSWVKRITVMFNGVSTSGTSAQQIQIGTASGVETTGYVGTGTNGSTGASPTTANFTAGFGLNASSVAAQSQQGVATIVLLGSNIWVFSFNGGRDNTVTVQGAGGKTLSGTLDRVRITTVNGTDTFDAGSINILYE